MNIIVIQEQTLAYGRHLASTWLWLKNMGTSDF